MSGDLKIFFEHKFIKLATHDYYLISSHNMQTLPTGEVVIVVS